MVCEYEAGGIPNTWLGILVLILPGTQPSSVTCEVWAISMVPTSKVACGIPM